MTEIFFPHHKSNVQQPDVTAGGNDEDHNRKWSVDDGAACSSLTHRMNTCDFNRISEVMDIS